LIAAIAIAVPTIPQTQPSGTKTGLPPAKLELPTEEQVNEFRRAGLNRNNRASPLDELAEEGLTFLILPRTKASVSYKDRC
jgi:hypothetical protein